MQSGKTVIDVEETIAKPLALVWHGLTSPEVMPEWMGVDEIHYEGGGNGPTLGGILQFRARGKDRPSTIRELEEHRRVAFESVQGGVTALYAYELEQLAEDRTKVRLKATCQTRGMMRMLGPLLGFAMRKSDAGQLASLKKVLESSQKTS